VNQRMWSAMYKMVEANHQMLKALMERQEAERPKPVSHSLKIEEKKVEEPKPKKLPAKKKAATKKKGTKKAK
jgi:hypothetical protein